MGLGTKYNIREFYTKYINTIDSLRQPFLEERKEISRIKKLLYTDVIQDEDVIKTIPGLYKYLVRICTTSTNLVNRKHEYFLDTVKSRLPLTIYNIISLIFTYTIRDLECIVSLRTLNLMKIKEHSFIMILYTFYTEIGNSMLNGYVYTLGRGLGSVEVKEYKRTFRDAYGNETGLVDYGTSQELLVNIAKEQEAKGLHKYYSLYKLKKYISRKQFNYMMREFTYSPSKPYLPKWIIYHTDEWIPLIIWKKSRAICALEDYTFKPTSWVNIKDQPKDVLTSTLTTTDAIIKCTQLGLTNKLFAIKKLDNDYYKLTR